MAKRAPRSPHIPVIVVTEIEPIAYGRKLVHLINNVTGESYEITYGDSVSEATIRLRAPILASHYKNKSEVLK